MKIIQSFAQFEEGSPYFQHQKNQDNRYLNLYSFLMSYLSLKDIYGAVTMFCNQQAYDTFIKYIPYDKIIIVESTNDFLVWSKYKTDVMRLVGDDLIHVDPDVFVLEDVFEPFITGDYDIMIQNSTPMELNDAKRFGFENKHWLNDTKILTKPYDGGCFSCGTVGLKLNVQQLYFDATDILHDAMLKVGLKNTETPSMLLEEQLLYFLAVEYDYKTYEIISKELFEKSGVVDGGDSIGYFHAWMTLKFSRDIINKIRKKIFFDFPNHYEIILGYERDVLSDFKFFSDFRFPILYDL